MKIPKWLKTSITIGGCVLSGCLFGMLTKLSVGTVLINMAVCFLWVSIWLLIFWRLERGAK